MRIDRVADIRSTPAGTGTGYVCAPELFSCMSPRESLFDVIGVLLRRRRLWLTIVGAAALLSILVALLLPVWYVATTVFLAASPDQNNYSKLFTGEQVEMYGSGNDTERVLAAAESEETVRFLIDSFDLYSVYDIDRASPRSASDVREEFDDHYNIERTKFSEIAISVEDQDPQRAAALANAARARTSVVLQHMNYLAQEDVRNTFARAVVAKEQRLTELADSIQLLSNRSGIIDIPTQQESLSGLLFSTDQQLIQDSVTLLSLGRQNLSGRLRDTLPILRARIEANRSSRASLGEELRRFTGGRSRLQSLLVEYGIISDQIAYDRERTRQLQSLIDRPGPVIYVSAEARLPDRKARPVRWLIVVGSTLAAAIFAAVGILVWDTYKHVPWSRYLEE